MMTIHENLYWEHLGLAGALAISVFVLIGLALRLIETPAPRMHIWAMIAFFGVNALDSLHSFAYSDVFMLSNGLFRWFDALLPGFMVSLYFYVRALTQAKPHLRKSDAVHLIPFAFSTLFLALGRIPQMALLNSVGETGFWAFWVVIVMVYGGLCIRRLTVHKRNVRAVFSDLEGKTLRWLDLLVATILILALIVIIDEIFELMGLRPLRDGLFSPVFDILLPLSLGVFALRSNPVLPDWADPVIEVEKPAAVPTPDAAETPSQRYARSGLQQADIDRYASRLEKRMAEGQLWRDHGLNLRSLAAEIAISPIHLSEVLNTKLGMTFYDYVNQCRIRDACELLIRSDKTIIEISETVGFNAKSTFNTSFKKVTDQTPSVWRARHRP